MSKKTGKPVKTNFFVPKILTVFNEWLWIVLLITRLFSTLSTQIAAHIKGEKVDYLKISEFTQKALTWAEYQPKQKNVSMKKVDFGHFFCFGEYFFIFRQKNVNSAIFHISIKWWKFWDPVLVSRLWSPNSRAPTLTRFPLDFHSISEK